jgi:hypothetical protein
MFNIYIYLNLYKHFKCQLKGYNGVNNFKILILEFGK